MWCFKVKDHSPVVISPVGTKEPRKRQGLGEISSRGKFICGVSRTSGELGQCAAELATLANKC